MLRIKVLQTEGLGDSRASNLEPYPGRSAAITRLSTCVATLVGPSVLARRQLWTCAGRTVVPAPDLQTQMMVECRCALAPAL
jgi:hypothetical protein